MDGYSWARNLEGTKVPYSIGLTRMLVGKRAEARPTVNTTRSLNPAKLPD